jgi:chaperonin GroES
MKFEPLEDRVLVKRIDAEKMYHGILHLPESTVGKPQLGEVIAVGPGKNEGGAVYGCAVKPGDRILFGKYSGTDIRLDEIEYIIMREGDILGLVHDVSTNKESEA